MNYSDKNILVTGGAGFIGSHLVEKLVETGCKVTVLDNLASGKLSNLDTVHKDIQFIEGDIRNPEDVRKAAHGCEIVYHLAAMVFVPDTVADPVGSAAINELGSLNVLEAAWTEGCSRVVLASSAAVYGDSPEMPKSEEMLPQPKTPYAIHKLAMEHYGTVYSDMYGLEAVSLRFFNTYGPRQNPSSPYSGVISVFNDRAIREESPVIFGDGDQTRDFIHVDDVVRACMIAGASTSAAGKTFNIGTGKQSSISRLWEIISKAAGVQNSPGFDDERRGDIRHSVADVAKAKEILGFTAEVSIEDGLAQTFEWYKANSELRD